MLFGFSRSPVQRYAAQVQYGRRGEQHVQRRPHQTEGLAVPPVAHGQLDGREGHDQKSDQEIRESQRHNEVVGLLFPVDVQRTVKCQTMTNGITVLYSNFLHFPCSWPGLSLSHY